MSNSSKEPIWLSSSSPVARNSSLLNPISIASSSPRPLLKTEPKPSNLRETHLIPSSPPHAAVVPEIVDMPTHINDPIPMSPALSSTSATRTYRKAKPLPYRLRQNTNVYLEDKSFTDGFAFLTNVVAAGTSLDNAQPAYTPSPSTLALCATLIVHPTFTTRAKSDEDIRASNGALRFLRNVNELVGPVHANMKTAFTFQSFAHKRRRERESGNSTPNTLDSGERDMGDDEVDSPFAREKSLFNQVEDFWQVVGWAFNCSIVYRKRWDRWKLWLDIMLDVLVPDLEEHYMQNRPQDSLISQYLKGKENRTAWREVMAAILADGSPANMNKFGEVWKNETKERKVKKEEEHGAAMEIDLDEGNFGDYDDVDDDDEAMGEAEQDEQVEEVPVQVDEHSEDLGGSESITLRKRFLRLLILSVFALPQGFPDLETLFDIYTECLRPLPLPIFTQFISTLDLEPDQQRSFLANLLLPFLPKTPPNLKIFTFTQEHLIKYFVPQSANLTRVSENVKLSLIVEALLMNMWSSGRLQPSKALRAAVKAGIEARTKKCKYNNKTKDDKDQQAQLRMSAERINLFLSMIDGEFTGLEDPATIASHDDADETPLSTLNSELFASFGDE